MNPTHSQQVIGTRLGRSVSIEQAAQILSVSRRTIYYRIRDGRLRTIRTIGGSQRVLVESLHDAGVRPTTFRAGSESDYRPSVPAPANHLESVT